MSLGIPARLAPAIFAKALSRLFLVYAATCLLLSETLFLIAAGAEHSLTIMWAGLSIGAPGAVLLYSIGKNPSRLRTSLYLLLGAASLAFCALAMLEPADYDFNTAFTPLAFMSFALVMVCGGATTIRERMLWLVLGYATSQIVLINVSALTGKEFHLDFRVLVGTLIAAVAILVTPSLLAKTTKKQESIDLSTEVAQAESFRSDATREATMAVHDTLLATLSAIGMAKPGPMTDALRRNAEKQLASLNSANWVSSNVTHEYVPDASMWSEALLDVIDEIEQAGLQVNMSGQAEALNLLSENQADALLAALAQCLTNVLEHSGQSAAEVVVLAADETITVTVIDSGVGFDAEAVPEDRLGLRMSVHRRIEDVGGTVNVWTGEGVGTAIMLKVPAKFAGGVNSIG